MDGLGVINELKKKFELSTDQQLADHLGMTVAGIKKWKSRREVTVRQLATLVDSGLKAGEKRAQTDAIRPLVEFFKLNKCESKGGWKYSLFSKLDGGVVHPYLAGLRTELESHHGVYVFFDSRGHAIYAGKARKQSLWKEMNLVFNRHRGEVQGIKRVSHPILRRNGYKTSEEKTRHIVREVVPLHEVASYFSAYIVTDGMIDELEAMLVRSFANDLLNIRMERFGSQRSRASKQ